MQRKLDHHAALIYTMVMVSAADRISDAELDIMTYLVEHLPIFQDFDRSRINDLGRECAELLDEEDGLDLALELIADALPAPLRETAYALACDVVAADGAAILGECGGFMVLGRGLVDAQGQRHEMAGLLPTETSFAARRLHLGYRQLKLCAASCLGPADSRWRGHEFHYATLCRNDAPALFEATDARGRDGRPEGALQGRIAGTFVHLVDRAP